MTRTPDPDLSRRAATECVCFNLRKTTRLVTGLYDDALRSAGLRATQFSLLNALHLAGPASVSVLAALLDMDRTTLTRNLAALERDRLVASRPGRDQRVRLIELTEAGTERLARALPAWQRVQEDMVDRLGSASWDSMVGGLNEVSVAVQARGNPPGPSIRAFGKETHDGA